MKRTFIFISIIFLGTFSLFADFEYCTSPNLGFSQGINIDIPENSKNIDLETMAHFLTLSSTVGVTARITHNSGWGAIGLFTYQLFPYIQLKSAEENKKHFAFSFGLDAAAMPSYTFNINQNCKLTLACGFSFSISLSILTDSQILVKKGGLFKYYYGGAVYLGMDYFLNDSIAINFSVSDLLGRNIDVYTIDKSILLMGLSNIFQVNIGVTFKRKSFLFVF